MRWFYLCLRQGIERFTATDFPFIDAECRTHLSFNLEESLSVKANKKECGFHFGRGKTIQKFLLSRKMGKVWKFGLDFDRATHNIPLQNDRFCEMVIGKSLWLKAQCEQRLQTTVTIYINRAYSAFLRFEISVSAIKSYII